MPRRYVISETSQRIRLRRIAIALALIALFGCVPDIEHVEVHSPSAGTLDRTVYELRGGNLEVRIEHFPRMALHSSMGPSTDLGWSIAFEPGLYSHTVLPREIPPVGLGATTGLMTGGESFEYHVSTWLMLIAGAIAFITLPLKRTSKGQCVCGYSLQGITAPRCPECGRDADPNA